MKSAFLQKLLLQQRQSKYVDLIQSSQWPDLHQIAANGSTPLQDILISLSEHHKVEPFLSYCTNVEPIPTNLNLITQLFSLLADKNEFLVPFVQSLRELTVRYPPYYQQLIDVFVRSFQLIDDSILAEALISLLPQCTQFISNSIVKYFPQTTIDPVFQIRFLRSTLLIFNSSLDITISALSRVFQHLIALDCELVEQANDQQIVVDEEIAATYIPQLKDFVSFIERNPIPIYTLLLQLFDLYMLDLPRCAAMQFSYFLLASGSSDFTEKLIGFFLAKLIDSSLSSRTRGNAALYIASLIAHAGWMSLEFVVNVLDYVADYANTYANHIRDNVPESYKRDIHLHAAFYYSVECICYVLCWKHDIFVLENFDAVNKWNLKNLVCTPLCALDAIDKYTADEFRNLRIGLELPPEMSVIERISCWFPFDKCVLDEVDQLIPSNAYIGWEGVTGLEKGVDHLLDQSLNQIFTARQINFDDLFGED